MASVTEVFDVEAEIPKFLTDPTRSCLELPHMTTGQRKDAKKIVEKFPQLTCESFGFGQERQLHLFKKVSAMPRKLEKAETQGSVAESKAKQDSCQADQRSTAASSDCSTSASDCSPRSVSMGSPASSTREVPESPPSIARDLDFTLNSGLQVRNTFIHISGASTDQRTVQSMPHGMFGQCLREESLKASMPGLSPEPVAEAADESVLTKGTEIMIQGLTKLPAFNGLSGVVQSFDEESGRYSILLSTPANDGKHKTAKVKGDNLWVIAAPPPPPPSHAPRLTLDDVNVHGMGSPSFPSTPTWEDQPLAGHAWRLTAFA